jgi:hypothetical protein
MGAVARSPADGYTILVASSSYQVNVSLYAKPPYADKDFARSPWRARVAHGLFVHPASRRRRCRSW